MRVLEPRATEAAAAVDGSSNDSDTLSGRSLGILIAFIGLFILIVAFACSRRNAHIRALALTRERERETQRQRKRPLLSDVQLTAARGGGTSWKSIQPLAARVIAPATRPTRQRTNGPQPLLPPPPTAGTNLIDYNALISDAWFSGVRNVNGPPTPPAPRPTAVRRREPAMHVAVLIAMPTPRPSAHAPGTSSFHHDISPSHGADSVNAHDHPPEVDPGPGPPPNVALGTARMPWRQREQARIFNFDGLA